MTIAFNKIVYEDAVKNRAFYKGYKDAKSHQVDSYDIDAAHQSRRVRQAYRAGYLLGMMEEFDLTT